MTTRTIGVKEFRRNFTKLSKKARRENICYIVMNHQTPVGRFEAIDEEDLLIEQFMPEIEEALEQVKRGEVYTADEVRKHLGIPRKKA